MKKCNKCGVEKPFTSEYFVNEKRNRSGLSGMCKECRSKVKKEWKENNPDAMPGYYKKCYDKNPELYKMKSKKRRSMKRSLPHTLTYEQWVETLQYFDNCCAYCGSVDKLTQEHFVPMYEGGGYTKNNIIPACNSCNSSKQHKDFYEWYPEQWFFNKDKMKRIMDFLNEGI